MNIPKLVRELTPQESDEYFGCTYCRDGKAEVLLQFPGQGLMPGPGLLGNERAACRSCWALESQEEAMDENREVTCTHMPGLAEQGMTCDKECGRLADHVLSIITYRDGKKKVTIELLCEECM